MHLAHITYQLGAVSKTLLELARTSEITPAEASFFERIMGIQRVPRNVDRSIFSQTVKVMQIFFYETHINPASIKYFLFAHTGDCISPASISFLNYLSQSFHFNQAIAFGSTVNKCASAFHFLKIASVLCNNNNHDDCIVILIADNAFTKILKTIPGSTILGDAVTVLLLKSSHSAHRMIDVVMETDGRFASGSLAQPHEQLLFQKEYVVLLSRAICDILQKNNLSLENIRYIFPHNVNTLSWYQIASHLNFSKEKIYLKNVARTAHCFGSDPFINLKDCLMEGRLHAGDYYLLVTVGLGATFAVALFQY